MYLPESFEWIILKSGVLEGKDLNEILERPEEFIESSEFVSWERFFYRFIDKDHKGYVFEIF